MPRRTLVTCGWLVTLDDAIGDHREGELLYEGDTILAAGKALGATADEVIDASDKIVMPGLVNAHMHTWETALRGIGAEWMTADYMRLIHLNLATRYTPQDDYLANLVGALGQIDAGTTTLVDWCHNITTLEHAERAIDGLRDSGIRAVFAHGTAKPPTRPKAFSDRAASTRSTRCCTTRCASSGTRMCPRSSGCWPSAAPPGSPRPFRSPGSRGGGGCLFGRSSNVRFVRPGRDGPVRTARRRGL